MKGFNGVKAGLPTKQEALLFDSIFKSTQSNLFSLDTRHSSPAQKAELEYLYSNGIVQYMPAINDGVVINLNNHTDEILAISDAHKQILNNPIKLIKDFDSAEDEKNTRLLAIILQAAHGIEAVPILPSQPTLFAPQNSVKTEVAQIILNTLPTPTDDTPWEQILDFRKDAEAQGKLIALRRWTRKVINEKLSISEIEDELEYLLYEYEQHMKLHHMKFRQDTIQTILTIPLEMVENLLKFKLKNIVDSVFSVRQNQISLLEAELSAPGREVAYIVHAQKNIPTT